jgi:hypothetical protein
MTWRRRLALSASKSSSTNCIVSVSSPGLPQRLHSMQPNGRVSRPGMLRIVAFCLGLVTALPAAFAGDALEDCAQEQDRDRAIHGCTAIIKVDPTFPFAYYNRGGPVLTVSPAARDFDICCRGSPVYCECRQRNQGPCPRPRRRHPTHAANDPAYCTW